MKKLWSIVNILASIGWIGIAINIYIAHRDSLPLTVGETVLAIIGCLFISFALVASVIGVIDND